MMEKKDYIIVSAHAVDTVDTESIIAGPRQVKNTKNIEEAIFEFYDWVRPEKNLLVLTGRVTDFGQNNTDILDSIGRDPYNPQDTEKFLSFVTKDTDNAELHKIASGVTAFSMPFNCVSFHLLNGNAQRHSWKIKTFKASQLAHGYRDNYYTGQSNIYTRRIDEVIVTLTLAPLINARKF